MARKKYQITQITDDIYEIRITLWCWSEIPFLRQAIRELAADRTLLSLAEVQIVPYVFIAITRAK